MSQLPASVLTRAAVLSGGVPQLAQALDVAPKDLLAWIGNKVDTPEEVLAKAEAIVNAYEVDRTGIRLRRAQMAAAYTKTNGKPAPDAGD